MAALVVNVRRVKVAVLPVSVLMRPGARLVAAENNVVPTIAVEFADNAAPARVVNMTVSVCPALPVRPDVPERAAAMTVVGVCVAPVWPDKAARTASVFRVVSPNAPTKSVVLMVAPVVAVVVLRG